MRCHPRFREYLLERLHRRGPDEIRAVRAAYGRLLAAEGHHEEAVEELLRAGDVAGARGAAEASIASVVERLDYAVAERWLRALAPEQPVTAGRLTAAEHGEGAWALLAGAAGVGVQTVRCGPAAAPIEDADALDEAGVDAQDVDLVLVATMAADDLTPNAAPLVAHALGAERAGALDIGAACSGFLAALRMAAGQIETGRADRVLVIGAEALTRITDFDDPKTAHLFGDGAGAVVLGANGQGHIGPIHLAADGGLASAITCDHGDRKLRMDGHSTYQTAVKRLSEATVGAVARAGLELEDVDLFVYHQANGRIIRAVGERLDLEPAKVADYVAHMANTSAASIPLTLSLLREDNRLRAGQTVLVGAIGAGFTWGAGIIEWGKA
jgi:3-oxoacyl-[acyl-carrier-protein] synthase-3